ncbi:hypothetical protein DRO33_02390, partial [Candidatus Bathyarchaeota archaeon]
MGRDALIAFLALFLLAASALSGQAEALADASRPGYEVETKDGWMFIRTDVVVVAVHEHKPLVVWWYVKDNTTFYVADYRGLVEYYLIENASLLRLNATARALLEELKEELRERMTQLVDLVRELGEDLMGLYVNITMLTPISPPEFVEELIEETERLIAVLDQVSDIASSMGLDEVVKEAGELRRTLNDLLSALRAFKESPSAGKLRECISLAKKALREYWSLLSAVVYSRYCRRGRPAEEIESLLRELHPPLFLFAGNKWEIEGPGNITSPDGKVIGIWFAYKLVGVRRPKFRFLEDRLMIRCRLYFFPVEERTEGLNYTLIRGELKQDVVVLEWKWNIDVVRELFSAFNLTEPEVERAGLALWLKLMCVNSTGVEDLSGLAEELHGTGEIRDLALEARSLI